MSKVYNTQHAELNVSFLGYKPVITFSRLTTLTSVFGQVQHCCSVLTQEVPVDRPAKYMKIMCFKSVPVL